MDDEALQAVEQVAAELAARDPLLERRVRRSNDAHVRSPAGAGGPDGAHLVPVEGAQQLGLRFERQIAHLVEEQRASLRLGERARAAAHARR